MLEAPKKPTADKVVAAVTGTPDNPCGDGVPLPAEPLALASVLSAAPEVPDSLAVDNTAGVATGTLENP